MLFQISQSQEPPLPPAPKMRKGDPAENCLPTVTTSTIPESSNNTETQSLTNPDFRNNIETQNLNKPDPGEDTAWPEFHNFDNTYPTDFEDGVWKCPLCSHKTPRIRQHLATHKSLIQDWGQAEKYCNRVAFLKRRELDRKRAQDPKRKESKQKAEKKASR